MFKNLFSLAFFLSFSLHSHSLLETFKKKLGIIQVKEDIAKNEPKKVCKVCQPESDGLIHFPDKQALIEKLQENGFGHFNEKTNLAENLTSHTLLPTGLMYCLECAFDDYEKNLKRPEPTEEVLNHAQKIMFIMYLRKPALLKLILDGCPDAYNQLKEKSLYQKLG